MKTFLRKLSIFSVLFFAILCFLGVLAKETSAAPSCSAGYSASMTCPGCKSGTYGSCGCQNSSAGGVCHGCGYRCGNMPRVVVGCAYNGTCCVGSCGSEENPSCCSRPPTYRESAWQTCGDYAADIGTYNGCKVPANTSACYWQSPQEESGHTAQVCGSMGQQGGCGGNTPCGLACDRRYVRDTDTRRRARDGAFQCGSTGACNDVTSGNAYLTTTQWGTIPGKYTGNDFPDLDTISGSTHASDNSPREEMYPMCKLNTVGGTEALEACSVTPGTDGGFIACRCGQRDMCDVTGLGSEDLNAQPAILKIADLTVEYPNDDGMINTYGKHRLKVTFSFAANQPGGLDKAMAYTRLIEVCPVNMQDEGWAIPVTGADDPNWPITNNGVNLKHWCVIKRVDGDYSAITAGVTIDIPNIVKDDISEGPWTVKYRTINDVCNRTFYDAGPSNGQTEYCKGGNDCLTVGATGCETGKMGGIQDQGNIYKNLTPGNDFNYCNI